MVLRGCTRRNLRGKKMEFVDDEGKFVDFEIEPFGIAREPGHLYLSSRHLWIPRPD